MIRFRGKVAIDNLNAAAASVDRSELSAAAARKAVAVYPATITTTGTVDAYAVAPETGTLSSIDFSAIDALTGHDSNYLTFSATNLGQAGAGTVAMLSSSDLNTTKATGGTALVANGVHPLTLHGTAANLAVTSGDRIRLRAVATGTLANTVTGGVYLLRFTGTT